MNSDKTLWEVFLLRFPDGKRDKISALIDRLPPDTRNLIKRKLVGADPDTKIGQNEPEIVDETTGVPDSNTYQDSEHGALSPEALLEIRSTLAESHSIVVMDEVLSVISPFIHEHVGQYNYDAEMHRETLFALWQWFWSKEAHDDLLIDIAPLVRSKGGLENKARAACVNRVRQRMVAPMHQFHGKLVKGKNLAKQIEKEKELPRLAQDLWDMLALLSGHDIIAMFEAGLASQLPAMNKALANQLFLYLKKYEKQPNNIFAALCLIIASRLKAPQDIVQIAVHLSECGMVLGNSPFTAIFSILLAKIDRLTSDYTRLAKTDADADVLAGLITEYGACSRVFRIHVSEAEFANDYKRYIDFQRHLSITLEEVVRSVSELTRRVLRTLSWIKHNPKLWLCDELDIQECYRAVHLLYTVEKIISELSLITAFTQAKTDFERYIEHLIKGLTADGEHLSPDDIALFKSLTQRLLDLSKYCLSSEYHKLIKSQFEQVIAHQSVTAEAM